MYNTLIHTLRRTRDYILRKSVLLNTQNSAFSGMKFMEMFTLLPRHKMKKWEIQWKVEHKNCILLDFLVSMLRTDVMRTPFIWIDILTQAIIYENFQTRKLFGFSQQTVAVTSLLLSHKFFSFIRDKADSW